MPIGLLGGTMDGNPPANVGDTGSIPGSGRSHVPWSNKSRSPLKPTLSGRQAISTQREYRNYGSPCGRACAPQREKHSHEKPGTQ